MTPDAFDSPIHTDSAPAFAGNCQSSLNVGLLFAALARAQGKFTASPRSRVNPFFKSKYSTLEDIWSVARAPLAENELSWVCYPAEAAEKKLKVVGRLAHSSGEWFEAILTVPANKFEMRGDGGSRQMVELYNIHTIASALTYTKRQLMSAVLGIPADEDDDGNAAASESPQNASGRAAPPKQAQSPAKAPQTPPATSQAAKKTASPPPAKKQAAAPPPESHGPPPDEQQEPANAGAPPANITPEQTEKIRWLQIDILGWHENHDFSDAVKQVSKNRATAVDKMTYAEAVEFIAGLTRRAIRDNKLNPDGSELADQ